WTVRDLINHVAGGATMFATAAETGAVPDDLTAKVMGGGDMLGSEYTRAFRTASDRAVKAFDAPGLMDKTLVLPFGTMPAPVALAIAATDASAHTCDLAKATDQAPGDEHLYEAALEVGKQIISDDFRTPGLFDAEQPCADGATASDRLLAFC